MSIYSHVFELKSCVRNVYFKNKCVSKSQQNICAVTPIFNQSYDSKKNSFWLSQNRRRNWWSIIHKYTKPSFLQPFMFVLGCVLGFFMSCCIQRKLFPLGQRRALFWINCRLNFRIFNRFCRGSQSYWIRWEHTEIDLK
jgi:hypothetical protein